MKANELRIGNWINHNKLGKINIHGISSHCNDFKIDNDLEWVYLKNCEYIKLTEEWLLSFGFLKHEFGYKLRYRDDNGLSDYLLINLQDFECELYFINHRISGIEEDFKYLTNVYHIHSLQNLYFALTNKELQIGL